MGLPDKSTKALPMSKGIIFGLFLYLCATPVFAGRPEALQPNPDDEQQIDQMFDLTNRLRAERRLPILGLDARLCAAAALHAAEMARYNYVSDRGHGIFPSNPGSRAWACGYAWSSIGETVCAGSPDVASVMSSWLHSPRHERVLMDAGYQEAGIGVVRGPTRTYWVLMVATKPENSPGGRAYGISGQ
jgi:uncharacterized protein YkwD